MRVPRFLIAIATAVSFAMSLPVALAHDNNGHRHHHGEKHVSHHGHKGHKHRDVGIAVAVGAAALILTAAAAKAHEGKEHYVYHRGYDSRDNAIASCLHRANRSVVKRGGYGVTLRKVKRVRRHSGAWKVGLGVKQRWGNGRRYHARAKCTVVHDRVVAFDWR